MYVNWHFLEMRLSTFDRFTIRHIKWERDESHKEKKAKKSDRMVTIDRQRLSNDHTSMTSALSQRKFCCDFLMPLSMAMMTMMIRMMMMMLLFLPPLFFRCALQQHVVQFLLCYLACVYRYSCSALDLSDRFYNARSRPLYVFFVCCPHRLPQPPNSNCLLTDTINLIR